MEKSELTLAEHAEEWAREKGEAVPSRDTPEWVTLYARWIEFAFPENWSKN